MFSPILTERSTCPLQQSALNHALAVVRRAVGNWLFICLVIKAFILTCGEATILNINLITSLPSFTMILRGPFCCVYLIFCKIILHSRTLLKFRNTKIAGRILEWLSFQLVITRHSSKFGLIESLKPSHFQSVSSRATKLVTM